MNVERQRVIGHLMALFTAFVWGITFVSSKIILEYFSPMAIMTIRFTLAYVMLWIIHPKILKYRNLKEELTFVAAGLTGVSGYFLMENTALLYTTVSNVGLILAAVPLFVAIVLHLFTDDEQFHVNLLYGFYYKEKPHNLNKLFHQYFPKNIFLLILLGLLLFLLPQIQFL